MNVSPVYATRQEESALINLRGMLSIACAKDVREYDLLDYPGIYDKITIISTRWVGNDYHGFPASLTFALETKSPPEVTLPNERKSTPQPNPSHLR